MLSGLLATREAIPHRWPPPR